MQHVHTEYAHISSHLLCDKNQVGIFIILEQDTKKKKTYKKMVAMQHT